jgi:lantibiotic modifying enzyme
MIKGSPRVPADFDAERTARELKIFLERASARSITKRRGQARFNSIEQIVAPIAEFGVARLRKRLRNANSINAKTVWIGLRQNLSDRLAFALKPTLRFQQKLAKAIERSFYRPGARRASAKINLLETFAEFPGLLETASRLLSSWIDAQAELFTRLFRDRKNLSIAFRQKRRPLRVRHIRAGLSDPHNSGRTVTMIQFVNGLRVIYKPRPCNGETVWFETLGWLNRNGIRIHFRIPKILPRKKYAWMEFLPSTSCKNLREVGCFYFRWGAQTVLAAVLGATDLHRENWLAVGSQPILVDAELLGDFGPRSGAGKASLDRHLPAILRAGLFPIGARDRVGFYRGIAPFDQAILKGLAPNCWPRCKGSIHKPSRYVKDLAVGFAAVAELFASERMRKRFFKEIVLAIPRNRRVLLRATGEYARLLSGSLEVRNMISCGERWRRLVRQCCVSAINHQIGIAEALALFYCEVPKFTTRRSEVISWRRFSRTMPDLPRSLGLLRSRIRLKTSPMAKKIAEMLSHR